MNDSNDRQSTNIKLPIVSRDSYPVNDKEIQKQVQFSQIQTRETATKHDTSKLQLIPDRTSKAWTGNEKAGN